MCPAGIAPMQPYGPYPGLPNVWMEAAGYGKEQNVMDWWWNDGGAIPGGGGPATGLNGSLFHLGDNGQVVGDEEKFTDKQVRPGLRKNPCQENLRAFASAVAQVTDETIANIRNHDPKVPMYHYVAFQVCHAPLEAPDRHISLYPPDWREDRRWCTRAFRKFVHHAGR